LDAIVFEDEGCSVFSPLNLLKHTSLLRWGTKTLLTLFAESVAEGGETGVWGREELREITESSEGTAYNERQDSTVLLVNSRAHPGRALASLTSKKTPFVALSKGTVVAGRANLSGTKPGVLTRTTASRISKEVPRVEAPPGLLFRGYWDLVESNGLAIVEQAPRFGDSLGLPATAKLTGPPSNLRVHGSADVEEYVSFDTRLGPIVIAEGVAIESFSRVSGPCYVGPGARVRSALLRGGTSIFEGCRVGGEVENSIIMPNSNKPHSGYVGDSYVGEWVNLGAGSTFSNLKNTYGNVRSVVAGKTVDTGMVKLGPAIGDMCKVSIGALVFAGKKVGAGSQVTGLVADDVPSFAYVDGNRGKVVELLLSSVLETQRRMKERRGMTLTKTEEKLIEFAFDATSIERRKAGATRGRIA
jgi:UDP-N-acetylglucosamine diphosphorylase/glucosamine-1-phosphate N-acetyltransferase